MADYETVARSIEPRIVDLFETYPVIVSVAPHILLDDCGKATGEAVVSIGLEQEPEAAIREKLPRTIAAIGADGERTGEAIEIRYRVEGPAKFQQRTDRQRPCPGGYSCGHPAIAHAGTLGGGFYDDGGTLCFGLTNNHVVIPPTGLAGAPLVHQPHMSHIIGQPSVDDELGTVARFVPLDPGRANFVDCALLYSHAIDETVIGIGQAAAEAEAAPADFIRKSGLGTETTFGQLFSTNAAVRVTREDGERFLFVGQLKYSAEMTAGGDSGSLLFLQSGPVVVGLHSAATDLFSYGNPIRRVLELLGEADVLDGPAGGVHVVPPTGIA